MRKKIVVDCKAISQFTSGIAGYFKPLLLDALLNFQECHFILVAPQLFDTSFLDDFDNWSIKIVKPSVALDSKLGIIIYDFITYPNALKAIGADYLVSPYYDFRLPAIYSNKSILTIHDVCYWDAANCYSARVSYYFKLLFWLNKQKVHSLITVSRASYSRISALFGESVSRKTYIVYNGFDYKDTVMNRSARLKKDNKIRLLYTGGIENRKNITTLLDVVEKLNVDRTVLLYITGNNSAKSVLKKSIADRGLESSIIFTGLLSDEELSNLYSDSDLVINLSLCEGFGRSNLEAIAHKVPLVCSDLPVFREIAGAGAFYCDPRDVDSIIKNIDLALLPNSISEDFDFSKFTVESANESFIAILRSLINDV